MGKPQITAGKVLSLLAAKHGKDVFFGEVNLGSAWGKCQRMDAWAMPRSWTKWRIIGYEIKVSRSDFVGDQKWQGYLDHCHELYFVAPKGVVAKEELPDQVGLLEVASTGTRLFTRRKAVRRPDREVDVVPAMSYLLMSRTTPERQVLRPVSSEAYWRQWLKQKKDRRWLGQEVSAAIRERVEERDLENARLRRENEAAGKMERACERLGINLNAWDPERELRKIMGSLGDGTVRQLREAHASLGAALDRLEGPDG